MLGLFVAAAAGLAPAGAGAVDAGAAAVDAGAAADPDAPTAAGHADRAEAHVGDPIRVTIVTVAKAAVPVNLPGTLALSPFSLLDRKESEQNLGDGRVRREFVLTVAVYEPGPQTMPAVEVTYLGPRGEVRTVRTEPIPIKIASVIANEPEPALKEALAPVVGARGAAAGRSTSRAGVAAAALGALATTLIVRRLRARRGARPGPPPRPAHEIALERLDRLGAYGFLEDADNRPFYFAVSEVIRDYLGGRYGFDSLEMTTDELMAELRARAGRELSLGLGEVQGWLSACDLVKFAKISPTAAEARGALESAIRIVTSTRPAPDPAVPPPPPASGGPTRREGTVG